MLERLYLFDIDGTLLVTAGAGIRAMEQAGKDLFGPDFSASGMDFAGRLDPLLLEELLSRNQIAITAARLAEIRARYRRRLAEAIDSAETCRALPGVAALLSALAPDEHAIRGLLTGNFAETGEMKLRRCGLDPTVFEIRVWGDDSPHPRPHRDHLPAVALNRYREGRGRAIEPHRVVIIGDTPHDIACAAAHGCRSVGVATGKYSVQALRDAGADAALADLSDTAAVLDLLRRL